MIKKAFISLCVLILLILFFLPDIMNQFLGNRALEMLASSQGAKYSSKKLELSWMGPQQIHGLKVDLKDGSSIAADHVTVDASIFSILSSGIPLVEISIQNLSASFLEGALQLQKTDFTAKPEDTNYRLSLTGSTTSGQENGQFLLEALVNPSTRHFLEGSGTIDRLPMPLIDKLLQTTHPELSDWATAVLGNRVNLNVQKNQSAILFNLDTETLKGKFSLSIHQDGFEFHNLSPFTYHASPLLFHLLKKDITAESLKKLESIDEYTFNEIQLTQNYIQKRVSGLVSGDLEGFPVVLNFSTSLDSLKNRTFEKQDEIGLQLQIPPKTFNTFREAFYGNGSGDYLQLNTLTTVKIHMEELDISKRELIANIELEPLKAKNTITGQEISFPQMNGQLHAFGNKEFSLQIHAGNSDLFISSKGIENLKVRATLNSFFYGIFSDLLTGDPTIREKAEATIGEDLNGEVTVSLHDGNGYVNGALKGDRGSIDLSAGLSKGYLTLRSPFILQTQMTPDLAQVILGPLLPFLSSGLESNQTIVLKIEPDNFYAPIDHPTLTNIQIGQGSLQLGRVQFKNDGAIESMLSILKPAATGVISVWFTPAYFAIEKGILTMQRMDMFVMQAYHLALWGNLDFNNSTVDMKLGLGGTALNKAFNMPSPLERDEMVAFPLRGPFKNPSVDKARAITQITGMIAKLQGTPQGFILGTFIQAAGKIGEDPIPPPTTQPLPWEGTIHPSGESAPSTDGPKSPIKQIIRAIGIPRLFL